MTYPLDSLPLLLSNTDLLGAGRQRNILIGVLGQQLHELLWVLGNHLGELRVASSNLLENGLEHLRLLLNDLAQLLELGTHDDDDDFVAACRSLLLDVEQARSAGERLYARNREFWGQRRPHRAVSALLG